MHTSDAAASQLRYRPVPYPVRQTLCERRSDGTLILRSPKEPAPLAHNSFAGFIPQWAERRGAMPAFCERDAQGEWRRLSWDELWQQVQTIGVALLELGLGQGRPLVALSGNSIELAVLLLAAEYVGVPVAPVSPAYSLLSKDFARLKGVCRLVPAAALFVQDARAFARAITAMDCPAVPVISVQGAGPRRLAWSNLLATKMTLARRERVAAAHAAIRPDDVARVLFTSGSTGVPKGVPGSYRNFQASAAYQLDLFQALDTASPPVFLDWLPWHHAFGGVLNLGRSVLLGATHYIDDGRPLSGSFDKTVRNLREVSPTLFNSVPSAWAMLAEALEHDEVLARSLFARVVNFGYGGASLPRDVYERIQCVAERTVGERIMFGTGLASTETMGCGANRLWVGTELADIGAPGPGTEIKLVPLDGGRHEIRVRGAHNFSGYLERPDLTAQAFDEEGYFRLGDAVRLIDAANPTRGMIFDGRTGEDFKLVNGTWVRVGAVRLELVERLAPLISDAVICGHDRDYVAALAWPNLAACKNVAAELADLGVDELVRHPLLIGTLRKRLSGGSSGASLNVKRLMLMAEPPSLDANEIADKGYVNQAATRTRRAHLVLELYAAEPSAHVAIAR